ncbi:MAG: hypothetical protein HOJ35_08050 [Bdellovibrionales bacterium]|nr:hypothetical protein [Bdellovibrionales bacterium]
MSEEDLINKLVEETLSYSPGDDEQLKPEELNDYFQSLSGENQDTLSRLLSELDLNLISVLQVKYISELKVFRIEAQGSIIDFPSNWSFWVDLNPTSQHQFYDVKEVEDIKLIFNLEEIPLTITILFINGSISMVISEEMSLEAKKQLNEFFLNDYKAA